MTTLVPISEMIRDHDTDVSRDHYDFIGRHAYGANGEHIGSVKDAEADPAGRIRYFLVEAGNWFSSKQVLIPVGLGRIEDDGVYFDSLTKDQVNGMSAFTDTASYTDDLQASDIRTLRGTDTVSPAATTGSIATDSTATTGSTTMATDHYQDENLFRTPNRLQLLEERLMVNKERYQAGSVEVGKRVETHTENVNVALAHEEVVIERHPVSDVRPVDGNVTLGAASETIQVDLEAERANVSKQAYVTEEVEVGKRTESEQKTYSDTVGREVLDVSKTGEVEVTGDTLTDVDGTNTRGRQSS